MSTQLEALKGYRKITVKAHDGEEIEVTVSALPVRKMDELFEAQSNEAALVALYCGQGIEWTDMLSHEAVEAILEAGDELNSPFFVRWLQRKSVRLEPIVVRMRALVEGEASRNGSPTLPSPAASPLTR